MFSDLITELQKPEYQGLSDAEAAQAVNAKVIVVRDLVEVVRLKTYAIKEGFFADIDEACSDSDTSKRKLCKNIMAWINDPAGSITTVDIDNSTTQTMLMALEHYQLISAGQRTEIIEMANKTIRWVDSVGLGTVGEGSVRSAREEA